MDVNYAWSSFTAFLDQYQVYLAMATWLSAAAFLAALDVKHRRRVRTRIQRGLDMTREERIHYKNMVLGDAMVEVFENIVAEGKLQPIEVEDFYRQFGGFMRNNQLRRGKLHPNHQKSILQKIADRIKRERMLTKPNIPGPKPGEDVPSEKLGNIVPLKTASFGSTILSLVKSTQAA